MNLLAELFHMDTVLTEAHCCVVLIYVSSSILCYFTLVPYTMGLGLWEVGLHRVAPNSFMGGSMNERGKQFTLVIKRRSHRIVYI